MCERDMTLLCVGGMTQIGILQPFSSFLPLPFLSPSSSALSPPIFILRMCDADGSFEKALSKKGLGGMCAWCGARAVESVVGDLAMDHGLHGLPFSVHRLK
jgi:hypothetical protein